MALYETVDVFIKLARYVTAGLAIFYYCLTLFILLQPDLL